MHRAIKTSGAEAAQGASSSRRWWLSLTEQGIVGIGRVDRLAILIRTVLWQQARFAVGFGFELVFFFAFLGQFFLALFESVVGCGQDGSFN